MAWHDTFEDRRDRYDSDFNDALADEIARTIAEDFRQNSGEDFSTSWQQKPWTMFVFDPNSPYSYMVSVKNYLMERLGSEAKEITLDFEGKMLLVR